MSIGQNLGGKYIRGNHLLQDFYMVPPIISFSNRRCGNKQGYTVTIRKPDKSDFEWSKCVQLSKSLVFKYSIQKLDKNVHWLVKNVLLFERLAKSHDLIIQKPDIQNVRFQVFLVFWGSRFWMVTVPFLMTPPLWADLRTTFKSAFFPIISCQSFLQVWHLYQ